MSVKDMAVTAATKMGSGIIEKKASKALGKLPEYKQDKIRGYLMVATALMLLVSGVRLLKRSNQS